MAVPTNKISQVRLPNETVYDIVPTMMTDSIKSYKASLPTLGADSTILINRDYSSKGAILYASSANTPAVLSIGSAGQVLTVNSSGVPAWANPTGSITDVRINSTSIVSSGIANFNTITAYNASTNKVATEADLPNVYRFI